MIHSHSKKQNTKELDPVLIEALQRRDYERMLRANGASRKQASDAATAIPGEVAQKLTKQPGIIGSLFQRIVR